MWSEINNDQIRRAEMILNLSASAYSFFAFSPTNADLGMSILDEYTQK